MLRSLLIMMGLICFTTTQAADLTIIIQNIQSNQGHIRIGFFDQAKNFPKKPSIGHILPAQTGSVTLVLKNIPPGPIALSVFHDINDNEDLDSNFLGMPSEPFGFSRNATGTFGPPSFNQASIVMGTEPLLVRIDLHR